MIRSMDDFFGLWEAESQATLKIFNALSDAALDRKSYSEGRTVYTLAWHMITTIGKMIEQGGVRLDAPLPEGQAHDVRQICEAYEKISCALVKALKANWSDSMLDGEVLMFGQKWTRARMLYALVVHQIHHRGQLTVLMRQAGVKVPGIYGPAREEWAAMGMQPME